MQKLSTFLMIYTLFLAYYTINNYIEFPYVNLYFEFVMSLVIRKATDQDFETIYYIFKETVKGGETFIYTEDTSKEDVYNMWMRDRLETYVCVEGEEIVGMYLLRQLKVGRGAHVANAAYMVHPAHKGKKIGQFMCEDSLKKAKELGYLAMQFNFVVSTNERAVKLWKKVGFKIIGTSPKAFDHAKLGLVDAYIMHRYL